MQERNNLHIHMSRKGLRTWIEIDKKSIKHNYSTLRKLLPGGVKMMSVVKSNAYGHSLVDFSHLFWLMVREPRF